MVFTYSSKTQRNNQLDNICKHCIEMENVKNKAEKY